MYVWLSSFDGAEPAFDAMRAFEAATEFDAPPAFAACPSLDTDLDREIERRLWELDEVDEALGQLSA